MLRHSSFHGWTVSEAICRTVDRGVLKHKRETKRVWTEMGSPRGNWVIRWGPGSESEENERAKSAKRLRDRLRDAEKYSANKVREQLQAGRLIAWAHPNSRLAPRQSILPAAWKAMKLHVRQSSAVELTQAKSELLDIRIFPVLLAPDAVEHLSGKTLVEAVQEFVFSDPQLTARRAYADAMFGKPARFGDVRLPYRSVWPVTYGQRRTWSSAVGFLKSGEAYYRPTRIADLTLEKRFARLVQFLFNGEIVAEATIAKTGERIDVPRAYWTRSSSYLDLENGDLLEMNRHADSSRLKLSEPLFTGLTLKKTDAIADLPQHRPPRSVTRKSIRNVANKEQIEADCALWLAGLMKKSLDIRPRPKREYRKTAIKKWRGKLSGHSFDRAWSKAIEGAGALAWKAAGAPRKSLRGKSSR